MAGFTSFLFNGQTPPAVTSDTNAGSSLPLWYSSYLSTLANQAANIASTPYQSYQGQRIAPKDTQEQQAYNFMGSNATNWQGPLQQAESAAGSVSGGFNPGQFQQYLSPYIGGVVNEIGRLGQRNLEEKALPTLENEFVGNGQFASDRNRTMAERLVRDTNADITGQQGMALQGAYQSAMQNYGQGQSTANQAASNLGGLAQMNQALTAGTAGALSASGATNRGFDQANLDLAYQDFQNQLNYPRQNVSFLNSVLRGSQVPTSQDTTSTAPFNGAMSPSPLATFAGITMAGMGLPKQARKGGLVRYADGGYRRGGRAHYARGGLAVAGQVMPTPKIPMRRRARMAHPRGGLELLAA